MNVYVLDTNIISYYLRGNGVVINNIMRAIAEGNSILIAPIAYYEIKRGLMAVGSQKLLNEFEKFCKLFGVGQLDNEILDVAAEIYAEQRKIGRMMEDADIFIAAFCKCWNFPLVTNNTKHFVYVQNLTILDWSK